MIPYRFTLSRKAGWSKPPDGIGCGRPSRYSNPYIVGQPLPEGSIASTLPPGTYIDGLGPCPDRLDYQWAVRLFNIDLHAGPAVGLVTFSTDDVVADLCGHPLGCWCPGATAWCHVKVLLRVANNQPGTWVPEHREGPPWPTK